LEIVGLAYDSRKVAAGDLFIAVPGAHTDGRLFLADAARRGACTAIGEAIQDPEHLALPYIEVQDVRTALANLSCAFYGYPAQQLCTIGVTGTDGKTTTCNLISAIFEAAGLQTGLMTTANFRISGQEWENATRQSTLEALEVQQYLRRMLDAGVTHAVIEATSHGLLPGSELMIATQLVGRFNVSNCLGAITTAYSQGILPATIAEGLAHVKGISGRMESINEGQPFSVIVDYAHTPDSLEKVLATLRPLTAGRLMVVFGSAGERDIQKRPIMGRIAAQRAGFFVITDEDPREEDRTRILQEI